MGAGIKTLAADITVKAVQCAQKYVFITLELLENCSIIVLLTLV